MKNRNFYLAPDTIKENLTEPETTFDATVFKRADDTGGGVQTFSFEDIATQTPEQIDVKSPQQPVYETGFPSPEYAETPYPSSEQPPVFYTNDPAGVPQGGTGSPLPGIDITSGQSQTDSAPAPAADNKQKYIKIFLLLLAVIIVFFIAKKYWK